MDRVRATAARFATAIAAYPAGAVLAGAVYAVACVVFVPVTLLAGTTLAVFGLWPGIAVAWTGGLIGAVVSHAVGGLLGPRALAWLPSRAQTALRRVVPRRAFWSIVLIRLSPVGNFGAFNLMAGALGVARTPFILGIMVGLLPGLLGLGVLIDRVLVSVRSPTATHIVAAIAVLGAGAFIVKAVRRKPPP